MAPRRRRFDRPIGERRYKKLFVIAAEGAKTEPQYFSAFNGEKSVIHVKCLKGKHRSSPPQVLKRMEERLKEECLNESDEAWLVVDKDQWSDEQLKGLHEWSCKKGHYGLALSNPKFEYWLLLHFEDGRGIASSQDCSKRLRDFLPDYDKGIDTRRITRESVDEAIRRAKARDNPRCEDWPRSFGSTTVYRLVENILKE
jgi:hypothetical protein